MSRKSMESPVKRIRKAMASAPPAPRHRKSAAQIAMAGSTGDESSHEDIARLAYALWESRRGQGGSPDDDWHQAQELLAKRG